MADRNDSIQRAADSWWQEENQDLRVRPRRLRRMAKIDNRGWREEKLKLLQNTASSTVQVPIPSVISKPFSLGTRESSVEGTDLKEESPSPKSELASAQPVAFEDEKIQRAMLFGSALRFHRGDEDSNLEDEKKVSIWDSDTTAGNRRSESPEYSPRTLAGDCSPAIASKEENAYEQDEQRTPERLATEEELEYWRLYGPFSPVLPGDRWSPNLGYISPNSPRYKHSPRSPDTLLDEGLQSPVYEQCNPELLYPSNEDWSLDMSRTGSIARESPAIKIEDVCTSPLYEQVDPSYSAIGERISSPWSLPHGLPWSVGSLTIDFATIDWNSSSRHAVQNNLPFSSKTISLAKEGQRSAYEAIPSPHTTSLGADMETYTASLPVVKVEKSTYSPSCQPVESSSSEVKEREKLMSGLWEHDWSLPSKRSSEQMSEYLPVTEPRTSTGGLKRKAQQANTSRKRHKVWSPIPWQVPDLNLGEPALELPENWRSNNVTHRTMDRWSSWAQIDYREYRTVLEVESPEEEEIRDTRLDRSMMDLRRWQVQEAFRLKWKACHPGKKVPLDEERWRNWKLDHTEGLSEYCEKVRRLV